MPPPNNPHLPPLPLFTTALLLRLTLLLYGLWQDAHSPLKYTDIDYLVFTDATRYTFNSASATPYARETYRYTPLLAWLLYPTTLPSPAWFSSGKLLFAIADLVAGYFLIRILRKTMPLNRACRFASIWLLNPMVATISTRGSSEGLLGALVTALLWAVLEKRVVLAGVLLGLGVHFKIYPFVYAAAVVWWMDGEDAFLPKPSKPKGRKGSERREEREGNERVMSRVLGFITLDRVKLALISLLTFAALNGLMYGIYGFDFVTHTYLHHVTRIDHRHNFSPYNILLYLSSSSASSSHSLSGMTTTTWETKIESLAFLPQLLLSTVLIPLVGAKKDLPTTMLAQTFAFVSFNKVCTSQYFLWYMVFLPLYLPRSSLLTRKRAVTGILALVLWVVSQGLWLQQGYNLEFLGLSTFVPGLWLASLGFFAVNCFILGLIIDDLAN